MSILSVAILCKEAISTKLYKERERKDEKTLQQVLHSIQVVALLASRSIGSLQSPSCTTALAGATIVAVATKDEEMETGAGEDHAKVGLLQDQMSNAAVAEDFLGGPALSVDTVFHFPQNPTECT